MSTELLPSVKVSWMPAQPADAEVVALCAGLEGNKHVVELDLRDNSELTEAAYQAVLDVVPKSRLGEVIVRSCLGISAELKVAIKAACVTNGTAMTAAEAAEAAAEHSAYRARLALITQTSAEELAQASGDPAKSATQKTERTRLSVASGKAGFQSDDQAVGLHVNVVDPGGAAEAAGVAVGMVCHCFQGRAFTSWQALNEEDPPPEQMPWVFAFENQHSVAFADRCDFRLFFGCLCGYLSTHFEPF